MRKITHEPEADAEIAHAISISDQPSEFGVAISDALGLVASGVLTPPRIGRSRYSRLIMTGYPYSFILEVSADEVRVMAFPHSSRKPGYWKDRLS